nr:hypothetical protein [Tanacetum cinerariifolium]
MDPYEEVAQQGQGPPLSPAYVSDPMELDEHVPVYDPKPEHLEYHAPLNDDIQEDTDEDSIDYPDEPEDGEEDDHEDPEEDPSEEHEPKDDDEDPEEDPNEEHEPEDEDNKESSEGSDETDPFKEDEIAITPLPPRHRRARISVRPQMPMVASTQALIEAFAAGSSPFPLPPTSPAYEQAPLGHRTAMIHMRDDIPEEDMPPRRRFVLTAPSPGAPRSQYDFLDTVEAGQDLIRSPSHDARTIARAADKAKDVGYVRALQASERRMMTSIEEVNLMVSYQAQEVHQAYLSSEAQNRELLARLETLKTHMSRMEWQRQSVKDLTVTQMMRIHALEAKARTDTVEDAGNSWEPKVLSFCPIGLRKWNQYSILAAFKKKSMDKYYPNGEIKKLEIELWNLKVRGNDVAVYTQRFQELALMCIKFLVDETVKIDKYIGGLPDNIHGNVMSARPKTLDFAIELANDLMDQKLRTYAERQNENKRKADDSSRNNQQ